MGKTKIDKDALVPSAKLTFATGLLTGIKEAVDKQRAKEIEKQKQQFAMMKFLIPLQQKQQQFEQTEKRGRFEFEATQSLALQESAANISKIQAQIEQWKTSNLLAGKQFGLEEQKFEAQKASTLFDQQQAIIASLQSQVEEAGRTTRARESIESAEGIAARREGGLDRRSEEARLATVEAGLTTNFRKNEDVLRSYQEELANPTSEFKGDPKLAQSAVRLAQRMLIDWAQLRDIAEEKNQPAPQIPDVLEIYKDESWFHSIFGVGKEEFGVAPKQESPTLPRPAPAELVAPKVVSRNAEIKRITEAVKDQYKGKDIPDVVIEGLRTKYTEEEIQKILGKKKLPRSNADMRFLKPEAASQLKRSLVSSRQEAEIPKLTGKLLTPEIKRVKALPLPKQAQAIIDKNLFSGLISPPLADQNTPVGGMPVPIVVRVIRDLKAFEITIIPAGVRAEMIEEGYTENQIRFIEKEIK